MAITRDIGHGHAARADTAASFTLHQLDLANKVANLWHPNCNTDQIIEIAKIIATNHQTLTLTSKS